MAEQVEVGKRFTVVIPKSLRKKIELSEGQKVVMKVEEGKIVMEPLPRDPYPVLERVIGEPYAESEDERRAGRWVRKHAGR